MGLLFTVTCYGHDLEKVWNEVVDKESISQTGSSVAFIHVTRTVLPKHNAANSWENNARTIRANQFEGGRRIVLITISLVKSRDSWNRYWDVAGFLGIKSSEISQGRAAMSISGYEYKWDGHF
ncbi:hypothetical protein AB6A40_007827 [Gnathostoma spinigerum]|uniref:Uncharacterized protein n=1 Tax=Gnathostoma spinigerum TaxID=75299 RepID=A0ABD6EVP5_9BILA